MEFLEGLFARAKANKRRIVLPESLESRTLRAADVILNEGLAEIILLGCTELSMLNRDEKIGHGYLDMLEVLARAVVMQYGKLKSKYNRLLT